METAAAGAEWMRRGQLLKVVPTGLTGQMWGLREDAGMTPRMEL